MDNRFQNHLGEECEHPPRERLLLWVDGELPPKEAAQVKAHLDACWPCRVKTTRIQEAIAEIVEFDEAVLMPRLAPPQGWRHFDRQLRQLAAESGRQSLLSKVFGSLGRFLPSAHLFSMPSPLARVAAVLLAAVSIVALLIRFHHEPIVSANELLRNAMEAQAAKLRGTAEPVVHQKLQVRRKDPMSAGAESARWEIWRDAKHARVRQSISEANPENPSISNATPRQAGTQEIPRRAVIDDLTQVLAVNHMDPQQPLSAGSYETWRNTLEQKRDEVTRSKLADGIDALTLRTIAAGPVNAGRIKEAALVVRALDWQPAQLRLSVAAANGSRVYELTATVSEVLSLAQVNPAIFAEPVASVSPTSRLKPAVPAKGPALAPHPRPLTPKPVATADLQVEALRLFNQVGADLGEQISVARTSEGILQITGILETDERKREIVNALGPIASHPAVHIEIQTVAEAVAKQSRIKASSPAPQEKVEISRGAIAAEPELRRHLSEAEAAAFAGRMVHRSQQAMNHAWAMKRLSGQFSTADLRGLSPDARAKWLGLIRGHARSFAQASETLRRELQPIFDPDSPAGGAANRIEITKDADLVDAIDRLLQLASNNDAVIRSAFTASTESAVTTSIKTPQFWHSLRSAENLAGAITQCDPSRRDD